MSREEFISTVRIISSLKNSEDQIKYMRDLAKSKGWEMPNYKPEEKKAEPVNRKFLGNIERNLKIVETELLDAKKRVLENKTNEEQKYFQNYGGAVQNPSPYFQQYMR